MSTRQPKHLVLAIAAVITISLAAFSCNNTADTSKMGSDTLRAKDSSAVMLPDTTKMDTASTGR